MVKRFYLNNLVSFHEVEIEFEPGLIVFSGPSGAGKSLLLSSLLALFGYDAQVYAHLSEAIVTKPRGFEAEGYETTDDELVVKQIKKDKLRYFLNAQNISKKRLFGLLSPYVVYLSARVQNGLESKHLLKMIDTSASQDKTFVRLRKEYKKRFAAYEKRKKEYDAICAEESTVAERIEFLRFEIEKIASLNPHPDEMEELLAKKKQLSRIDKLKELIERISPIFGYEHAVEEFYRNMEGDASIFEEAMNRLRTDLQESQTHLQELEDIDVESMLDRIGALNLLMKRFGSIEGALAYKQDKEKELSALERYHTDKEHLERYLQAEYGELTVLARRLSALRRQEADKIARQLANYLKTLRLPPLRFRFDVTELHADGIDTIDIDLQGSSVHTLSGGEYNRVRLALLSVTLPKKTEKTKGVVFLDEIDANVSGEESIAIADMIEKLSSAYQVFAISHQPHLAAKAHQHILVTKEDGKSRTDVLNERARIEEIARIVGGENPTDDLLRFARQLRSAR